MMSLRKFAVLLIGFTATSAQIVLLREFINTFHGNELVIGIYLSVWLLATAVGSGALGGLFSVRVKSAGSDTDRSDADNFSVTRFAIIQALSGIGLLFAVLGLLALPSPLSPGPGEVAGLVGALVSAILFLSPFCLLQGLLFPLGAGLLGSTDSRSQRLNASISRVYLLESIGACAGGFLFGLILTHLMSSFQNVAILSAVNLFSASFLLGKVGRRRHSQYLYLVASIALVVCVLDPVTEWAALKRWKGFEVVALRQSHYGNLAVVSIDSQFSTYENGFLVFTTEDVQSSEEIAHIPLLEHPAPSRVLLIGGGVGGVVKEMLKHKEIVRLDYVELDPELITLSKEVLPEKYVSDLEDPRVRVEFTDGRRFLQKTAERYDVVAMQIPPPYTAQLNRFYTKEFFALVRSRLNSGGVFAFSAPPVAEYVGHELGAFLGSLARTSDSVFESRVIVPASRSFFVCSPDTNPYVVASPESLLSRLAARNIQTIFVRDYFLMTTLSRERLGYVENRIASSKGGPLNTDLRPTSFYYDMVLWSAEYERFMKGVLEWMFRNQWCPWAVAATVGGMLIAAGRLKKRAGLLLSALAVSGFAAIVLELETLLCFQLLYGNLYDRVGLLLTSYMLGLALGTVLERRNKHRSPSSGAILRRPATIQIATAVFALCFLGTVYLLAKTGSTALRVPASPASRVGTTSHNVVNQFEWLFGVFALVAGTLGGALFSSASRAFFACADSGSTNAGPCEKNHAKTLQTPGDRRKESGCEREGSARPECSPGRRANSGNVGITYAWDLAGSWLGAILCSAVLFPVAGVAVTTATVAVLLVASGVGLALASD